MFYDDIDALGTYIEVCLDRYEDNTFLCELDEDEVVASVTYKEAKDRIQGIQSILKENGIKPNDKIALLGENSINWGLVYMAVVTYGAIIVPILHEFDSVSISNIINMSESRILFVSSSLLEKVEEGNLSHLEKVYLLDDFREVEVKDVKEVKSQLKSRLLEFKNRIDHLFFERRSKIKLEPNEKYKPKADDIAAIVYTSGTTGRSKGVMLTHKNIYWNILAALDYIEINSNDKFLSILPSSHTYECTFTLLLSMVGGASVYYLKQKPSPKILLKAFEKVKPTWL